MVSVLKKFIIYDDERYYVVDNTYMYSENN